jgi:trans-aconitate 2-methyltransferase
MPTWDAGQYLKFVDERTQPARDLARRVPAASPRRVIDLGCGPGNSTEVLAERWPEAELTGLDNAPDMLAKARKAHPGWRWQDSDIARWRADAPYDVIYSNAALHWLDDHAGLFVRLFEALAPGGALAVQMPNNLAAPSHALMRKVAADGPWRERLAAARGINTQPPAFYYDLLAPRAAHLQVWETEYLHVMDSSDGVLEWVRGTGLRPYLDLLDEAERAEFERRYRAALAAAYPGQANGKVLFPFRRLFIVACR